jgi:hypothetical protein
MSLARPAVVSRRAWKKLHDNLLANRNPSSSSSAGTADKTAKAAEKPWPKSMQITGYAAAGIAVPYFSLWLITSNPTLRSWFGPFLPMDKLRSHFGHLESDAYSYADMVELERQKQQKDGSAGAATSGIDVGFYQFPKEMPYRERLKEQTIKSMDATMVAATVLVEDNKSISIPSVGRGQPVVLLEEKVKVPASALATQSTLKSLLKSSIPQDSDVTIAVEFDDDNDQVGSSDIVVQESEKQQYFEVDGLSLPDDIISQDPARALLQATHTFSSWYSIPVQYQQQEKQDQKTTDREKRQHENKMEISRLEYTIAELERNLKDPTCTRDLDDMVAELKQAKRQLSTLKWKQRLGW